MSLTLKFVTKNNFPKSFWEKEVNLNGSKKKSKEIF